MTTTQFDFKKAYIDIRTAIASGNFESALATLIAANEVSEHRIKMLVEQGRGKSITDRNHAIATILEISEYWHLTDNEIADEMRRMSGSPIKYIIKYGLDIVTIGAIRIALFDNMSASGDGGKILLTKKFNDLVEEFFMVREKYRDDSDTFRTELFEATDKVTRFYTKNMSKK
jgi:hypothetical protein